MLLQLLLLPQRQSLIQAIAVQSQCVFYQLASKGLAAAELETFLFISICTELGRLGTWKSVILASYYFEMYKFHDEIPIRT
jgi:hypothetical protein